MFDRFTDGAKHAFNHGRQEAQAAGHDGFSTGHVLLGLMHPRSGPAGRILAGMGLRADELRKAFRQVVKEAGSAAAAPGALPFSSRAKAALESTLVQAQALGACELGSEHLLLGLLEDGQNDACRALRQAGIELGDVRAAALRHAQHDDGDAGQPEA